MRTLPSFPLELPGLIVATILFLSADPARAQSTNVFGTNINVIYETFDVTTLAGKQGVGGFFDGDAFGAQFNYPIAITGDAAGYLYVSDFVNHTIRQVDRQGNVTTIVNNVGMVGFVDGVGAAARLNAPRGLAMGQDGSLLVVDSGNGAIRRVKLGTNVVTTVISNSFWQPKAIVADSVGNIFVTDSKYGFVWKITPSGSRDVYASGVGNAQGMCIDAAGALYVSDADAHVIRKIPSQTNTVLFAGIPGNPGSVDGPGLNARFRAPMGLSIDANGNIFVADSGNSTIRKISPGGIVHTVAGSPTINGRFDGVGSMARFFMPNGVFVDPQGKVFVADSSNNSIRQAAPDERVQFTWSSVGVSEEMAAVPVEVSLGRPYTNTVSVDFTTRDGSETNHAIAGIDYVATNGTVNFLPGQMSAFINVPILNNAKIDGARFLHLSLANPVGAPLGASDFVIVIIDNDSAWIGNNSSSISENAGTYQFRVERSGELGQVRVVTSDGSSATNRAPARAGIDYVAVDQTINFSAGETSKTIPITIINNSITDGSRRFTISLYPGDNRSQSITVDILDNDNITVGPNADAIYENAGPYQFQVRNGGDAGQVRVVTSDGATNGVPARAGIDYVAIDQIVDFAVGDGVKSVSIPIINNAIIDGGRDFTVSLYVGDLRVSSSKVRILDNDAVFIGSDSTVREDSVWYQFSVRAAGELAQVRIVTSDGTNGVPARAGIDYGAVDQVVNFAPGDSLKSVPITILNNKIPDGTRNFYVKAYSGDRFVGTVNVSILDNDGISPVGPFEVFENEGTLNFTVSKVGDTESFNYFTADGPGLDNSYLKAALNGQDYKSRFGTVTFAPGQTNAVVSIPIYDNPTVDNDRFFTLNLVNAGEPSPILIHIHDNELSSAEDLRFASNARVQTSDGSGGWIRAITPQRDGKILIGGEFDVVNGQGRTNIARLNADGTLDTTFTASVTLTNFDRARVDVIRLNDNGEIVIAGHFDQVDGVDAPLLARLKSDGSLATGFSGFKGIGLSQPNDYGPQIKDVLLDGSGFIYVAGQFDSVNGVARTNLARLNGDGSVDLSFKAGTDSYFDAYFGGSFEPQPFLSSVQALALWSGGLVIGGEFSAVNGLPRNSLAWLDWSGAVDTNLVFTGHGVLNGDNPGVVRQIVPIDDSMIIAGYFTSVRGVGRQNMAYLNPDGTLYWGFNLSVRGSPTLAMPFNREFFYELNTYCGGFEWCTMEVRKLDPYSGYQYDDFTPPYIGYFNAAAAEDSRDLLASNYGGLRRFFAESNHPQVGFQDSDGSDGAYLSAISGYENGSITFTVERLGDSSGSVTLNYATTNGTALAGLNYTETKGQITLAPLEVSKTISVPLLSDGTLNDQLTFGLRLTSTNCCGGPELVLNEAQGIVLNTDLGFTSAERSTFAFTTFAGAAGTGGSTDGVGVNARFNIPFSLVADASNNLYVSDRNNHTVRKITPAGVVSTYAGQANMSATPGFTEGFRTAVRFSNPGGLVFDSHGNLFIAADYTIRKITPAGQASIFAGSLASGYYDGVGTAARFAAPTGLGIDATDTLYVLDSLNAVVRKISPQGVVTTLAGHPNQYDSIDGKGTNAFISQGAGLVATPEGIVYFTEQYMNVVRRITPDGTVTTIAGKAPFFGHQDGAGANARFAAPYGITLDPAGDLIVADYGSHCIRRVTPGGEVTTIAGVPWGVGSSDGAGLSVRFFNPSGVAFDNAGWLYETDGNNTIRKGVARFGFTLAGAVGQVAVLEASADLQNWQPIATNTWNRIGGFADFQSQTYSNRFYRLRKP